MARNTRTQAAAIAPAAKLIRNGKEVPQPVSIHDEIASLSEGNGQARNRDQPVLFGVCEGTNQSDYPGGVKIWPFGTPGQHRFFYLRELGELHRMGLVAQELVQDAIQAVKYAQANPPQSKRNRTSYKQS